MTVCYVGLSVSGHDPAFALVDADGHLMFAEATERYVQDKRAWGMAPDHYAHIAGALALHCPDATRLVIATSWARPKPASDAVPAAMANTVTGLMDQATAWWLREHQRTAFLGAGANLRQMFPDTPIEMRHFDHHLCHAAYACASSPFDDAKCLVLDGEGEVGALSAYTMRDRILKRDWRSWGPGSLGGFYSYLTQRCGFDWRVGEEWKVMGLAAFGTVRPEAVRLLEQLVQIERGRPRAADPALWDEVAQALAPWSRASDQPISAAADLAASGQAVYAALTDEVVASLALTAHDSLVLSGGCALNSSYNGTLAARADIGQVHVPCAPADDGNAVGAALLAWQEAIGQTRLPTGYDTPYLGTAPDHQVLDAAIRRGGFGHVRTLGTGETQPVADLLAGGAILGVMRGRAEFGPRALGNRSILADPRPADTKDRLNRDVKGREAYRPFAPIVAVEHASEWFKTATASPYMSFTHAWRDERRTQVPAVVHEDGTGRLQTVDASNAWLHELTAQLGQRTGVPILLNTSLNVMGKPIVHDVVNAVAILATTGLDALLVDDVLIEKHAT